MTADELIQWVRYHDAAFQGYRAWANQLWADSKDPFQNDEDLQNRIKIWLQRFEQIPLEFASRCTEEMYRTNFDQPFGKHSSYVYDKWKQNRQHQHVGKVCRLCNNTGLVGVVFKEPRLTFGGNPLPDNEGTAACKCSLGTYVNECRRNSKDPSMPNRTAEQMMLPVFEGGKMAPWRGPALSDERRKEIKDRLMAGGRGRLLKTLEGLGL